MVNGMRTIYSRRSNKWFTSKFSEDHQSLDEDQRAQYSKRCDNSKKDGDNSPHVTNINNIPSLVSPKT